ncbi:unnamed protein product [Calypogeia fissa]
MTGGGIKHGIRSKALVIYLQLLVSLLSAVVQIAGVLQVAASKGLDSGNKQPCSLKDPAMDPTHEMLYGTDVVWQIPPEPKAVLLLAHGIGMESLQFFDPGSNCEQCYGMPECRTAECMSEEKSKMIYAALEAAGWLDSGGYVMKDPATGDLESVLVEANALPYCAVTSGDLCHIAHVKQELNTAYAVHSFTNDANYLIFPWLDSHILSPALTASI